MPDAATPSPEPRGPAGSSPASSGAAVPSTLARVLAFAAIVVAGACGGLIGWAVTDLQCDDGCTALAGVGALIGAVIAAGGVAIVAVLTLRAMTEWRTIDERQRRGPAPRG
ncbi:MAG TPA: hypothetical protein VK866_17930 [Acidimicrobiales bacterium]|nr:hypothetical protein [Acidimicrobiales bacterium]